MTCTVEYNQDGKSGAGETFDFKSGRSSIPPKPPEVPLTRDECFRLLEMYKDWNIDQRGMTDQADQVLRARWDLLIRVYKRLEELV